MLMMGDKKKAVRAVMGERVEPMQKDEGSEHEEMLEALGEEALQCVHEKDSQGFVKCMEALFRAFDASPHKEGPHE